MNGLVPFLNRIVESEAIVDLQDVFLRLASLRHDLQLGLWRRPGSLSLEHPTVPFAKAMDDAMEAVVFHHLSPSLRKTMRWLRIGSEKRLAAGWEVIDHFLGQNIAGKKEEKHQKEDLLTTYIN